MSTWKQTHSALAQLVASLGTEAGVPCTADERKIPSLGNTNSKGDVMTLIGGVIPSSPSHPFTLGTRLIMDVTLGHVYDTAGHSPKPNSLRDAENRKRAKYEVGYRRQGYAFAPLACNSLGQCGPDLLCWLWILADRSARLQSGLNPLAFQAPLSSSSAEDDPHDVEQQRAYVFRDNKLRVLAAIFEAVTERVHGRTFAHSCSTAYLTWLQTTRTQWTPQLTAQAVPTGPLAQADSALPQ